MGFVITLWYAFDSFIPPHMICILFQTSLLRALAPTTPTYVFPAMNTLMYEHPLTNDHIRIVRDVIGYQIVGPIGKKLACGDIGVSFLFNDLSIHPDYHLRPVRLGSHDRVEGYCSDRCR